MRILIRYTTLSHGVETYVVTLAPLEMPKMSFNKILPPTPPSNERSARVTPPGVGEKPPQPTTVYSSETYAQLLEQENEQLRLKNKQLQLELDCLKSKIDIQDEQKKATQDRASQYTDALRRRDKIVAEMAETIMNEFQRYKHTVQSGKEGEEIKVYSRFDGSPV